MTYTYGLRTDRIINEDGSSVDVYGITAFNRTSMQIEDSVPDIFFDRKTAEDFVSLCNSAGLSILHLHDVAKDRLA